MQERHVRQGLEVPARATSLALSQGPSRLSSPAVGVLTSSRCATFWDGPAICLHLVDVLSRLPLRSMSFSAYAPRVNSKPYHTLKL